MTLNGYAVNIENFIKNNYVDNIVILNELDRATLVHSRNVLKLSKMLGKAVGLNSAQMKDLHMGALFHDIGKLFISDEILNKKGKLTEKEMNIMKTHSQLGYDHMKVNSNLPQNSLDIILEHHEKLNGLGYPNNKFSHELSIMVQIVSICDVYDALVSERAYKNAMSTEKAIKILNEGRRTQFDEGLLDLFTEKVLPCLYSINDEINYPA